MAKGIRDYGQQHLQNVRSESGTAGDVAAGMARAKNYMRGMKLLASGTTKSAGQYGAESAAEEYTRARKATGLEE